MIKRAMGYLKVRTEPGPSAAHELEAQGFTVQRGVFSAAEVEKLRTEIDQVFDAVPPDDRAPRSAEGRAMFRYGMLNHSAACQQAVAHRGILDVLEPLLGEDCHVIANTAWRNPPASTGLHGGDAWHIDAGPHIPLAEGVTWPAEIPHPVGQQGEYGYPITIYFTKYQKITQVKFSLVDAGGASVPCYLSEPDAPATDFTQWNTICAIPKKPLHPGKVYTIKVRCMVDELRFNKTIKFKTTGVR